MVEGPYQPKTSPANTDELLVHWLAGADQPRPGFTIASMLCGMATSLPTLIIARVLQGLTGGGLRVLRYRSLWAGAALGARQRRQRA